MLVFVLVCITLCPWKHHDEEERAGCFAFVVFRISGYCKCPIAIPYGVVGWAAVCDFWYFLIIITYLLITFYSNDLLPWL